MLVDLIDAANDCVGTGPRLQMLTANATANRIVEQEFFAWGRCDWLGREATYDAVGTSLRW